MCNKVIKIKNFVMNNKFILFDAALYCLGFVLVAVSLGVSHV